MSFLFGSYVRTAVVVEDRGPLAGNGEQLVRVSIEMNAGEDPFVTEMPARHMTLVAPKPRPAERNGSRPMKAEARSLLDRALKLSESERTTLAVELLATLDGAADAGAKQAWAREITQRAKRARAGRSKGTEARRVIKKVRPVRQDRSRRAG